MKIYGFPYGNEEWDSVFECELTEDEAERLEASAHEEPRFHLNEDDAIADIYDRIEQLIFEANKRTMKEDGALEELREEYNDESDDPMTDDDLVEMEMGDWFICYPEELQDLDPDEDEDYDYSEYDEEEEEELLEEEEELDE